MAFTVNQLNMLKVDLGLLSTTNEQDVYLGQLLDAAQERLTEDGITLTSGDPQHDTLVEMYAAWLYRKRASDPAQQVMPKMLQLLRNSVLFGQKMAEGLA